MKRLIRSVPALLTLAPSARTCRRLSTRPAQEPAVGLPNPASVHCEEQGGTLEIRTGDDGGQAGYCIFDDGSECEEWSFFRGECRAGELQPAARQPCVRLLRRTRRNP